MRLGNPGVVPMVEPRLGTPVVVPMVAPHQEIPEAALRCLRFHEVRRADVLGPRRGRRRCNRYTGGPR